ncbi:MAG: peptide deformylase [candidate division Zixibacteria bacterium]|nr:peptide deformylase [candidate division Zixibacteria bacterium]
MSILKIARMGHPVLRQMAEPIKPKEIRSDEIQRLIDDMFETMVEYSGVGLAAPQVHVSKQLLVTEDIPDPDSDDGYLARRSVVINPEITFLTEEQIAFFEGCLSIPDIRGRVPRIRRIRLRGFDPDGNTIDREVEGFPAVVYQHEVDHLKGILFPDRMGDLTTLSFGDEYSRYMAPQPEPLTD